MGRMACPPFFALTVLAVASYTGLLLRVASGGRTACRKDGS